MSLDPRPCPLCGAVAARPLLGRTTATGERYEVVQCRACDLRYTRPLPTPAALAALYGADYYGSAAPRALSWDGLRLLLHRLVLRQRLVALLGRPPGRILDVGCGDGDFLAMLKRRGWEVHGTEFSAVACERARVRGVTVHCGELAGADLPDQHFDVITLWHVLEHLPAPRVELAEVGRLLRPGGLLVIEVPDSASPTFARTREHWFPLGLPGHLQHFTPATLARLVAAYGFTPVAWQHHHHFDFLLSFMSFMSLLGPLDEREGGHYFVDDFRRASAWDKARFLLLGGPVLLVSLAYAAAARLGANGETVTLTANQAPR